MLVLSACFSSSETAMIALDRYRLKHAIEAGNRSAIMAERFLQKPDKLLSLILLGNNFVNIFASTLMTLIALRIGGDLAIASGTGILTFLMLIFSELAPKTFATRYPEKIAFVAVYPLTVLEKLLFPATWVINFFSNSFLQLIGTSAKQDNQEINRQQLLSLINDSDTKLNPQVSRMIANLLEFEDYTLTQIMVPKHEIVGIDMHNDAQSILSLLRSTPFNRLPVYQENIDQIIGILHTRDVLSILDNFSKNKLWKLVSPAYFVPENIHLHAQLQQFRLQKKSFAMLVDEYGEITGLVTISDLLEELVGRYTSNITDEVDEFEQRDDGTLVISASYSLRDLSNEHGIELSSQHASSVNGYVIEKLGSLPEGRCCLRIDGLTIEVTELTADAIIQVAITNAN